MAVVLVLNLNYLSLTEINLITPILIFSSFSLNLKKQKICVINTWFYAREPYKGELVKNKNSKQY